jgi:hypothetical protein
MRFVKIGLALAAVLVVCGAYPVGPNATLVAVIATLGLGLRYVR